MSTSGMVAESAGGTTSDVDLVAGVRAGNDAAFEELYRRYHTRIRAFAHQRLRDAGRAEDVTQEAFLSALRRLRATDSEIAFKPWLFEIARNATIDVHRRNSRAEEVPVDDDSLLTPSDRGRLIGAPAPDAEVFTRERLEHLSGAFDELPEVHHRALVMREFEGRSYREIGERLDLTRSAVESTLFRARRRLEHEYTELEAGRHCESARATMALIAEGLDPGARRCRRFARHARRCLACRSRARELGVPPLPRFAGLRKRAAALLPLPLLLRRRAVEASAESAASGGMLAGPGAQMGAGLMERAASVLAAAALAGAGGAALHGVGGMEPPAESGPQVAAPPSQAVPAPTRPGTGREHAAPSRGAVVDDRAERARARSTRGRRDDWAPGRAGSRAGGRRAAPAKPGDASGPVTQGGDLRLELQGAPAQPNGPGASDATGIVVPQATKDATATITEGTGRVDVVRESAQRAGAVVDTTGREATGLVGRTGKNGLNVATDDFS